MAYNDLLKIRTWSLDGSKTSNVADLLQSKTWSGSYTNCARQLSYSLLTDGLSEIGGRVRLYHEADILFSGSVFRRDRSNDEQVFSCTAYDRGIYLKKNNTYLAVRNQTAEAVTAQVCKEFGVKTGSLAATGVSLTRNFLGVSLYQIIQTMYTLAAEQTGKKYQIRFKADALEVVEKALGAESIRLVPGSNLLSCKSVESIENLVTSVGVYDDEYKKIATYDSTNNYRALYGLMQQAIRASDKEDPATSAKQILEDNGIKTTITANCLGNTKLITGNAVVVHEPVTGTDGLFWIEADTHSVTRGIYRTELTLDFQNLMDKQTAGSVPTD
jgi:hypothetical protein